MILLVALPISLELVVVNDLAPLAYLLKAEV